MAGVTAGFVYQFKITLKGTEPLIWRRIQIPGDSTFYDLHLAIQQSMGWKNLHMHEFVVNGVSIGVDTCSGSSSSTTRRTLNEKEIHVADIFTYDNYRGLYQYDISDEWDHELVLEEILATNRNETYPKCIDGARAGPPEDCGGPYGYSQLLQIIDNPQHREYEERLYWLSSIGYSKKPHEFSPAEVVFQEPTVQLPSECQTGEFNIVHRK